jgi:hypothetical protein
VKVTVFADEGVSPRICAAVARRGLRVVGFPASWKGLNDQEMLRRAMVEGARSIMTRDRKIGLQSNLASLSLGIVVLPMLRTRQLLFLIDEISTSCLNAVPGTVHFFEVPRLAD